MSVLKMKPHRLLFWCMQDSYIDENGDKHEGQSELVDYCNCDLVPASGTANEITFDDGIAEKYSYIIYLPKDSRCFSRGDKIVVRHFCKERTFTVKGFQRYQHQCKLWV